MKWGSRGWVARNFTFSPLPCPPSILDGGIGDEIYLDPHFTTSLAPPVNFWMKGILEEGETVVNGGTGGGDWPGYPSGSR